jgi:hypothetical protein
MAHVVKEEPHSKTRDINGQRLKSSLVLEWGSSFTTV